MDPVDPVSFPKLSVQSLLHFTRGEYLVVIGDCRLNLSGSTIKLMFNYIKCCKKKLYIFSSKNLTCNIANTSRDSFFMCTDVT